MISPIDINLALNYNRGQGFTYNEILLIQRICEVEETGIWNRPTIVGICSFQRRENIEPDGKVWRNDRGNTWPVIKSEAQQSVIIPENIQISLWLDCAPKKIMTKEYFEELSALGISNVAFMINEMNTRKGLDPWSVRWGYEHLKKATDLAAEHNIGSTLTIWPQPNKSVIDASMKDIEGMIILPGVEALEIDTEGNWRDWALDGFKSMKEAGKYLAIKMRAACELNGHAHTELTTYPSHEENSPYAVIAKFMDVLLPQCYSIRNREGRPTPVPWNHRYGPGRMQDWGMARAALVPGKRQHLACGLAAWDQAGWEEKLPEEAMEMAFKAAIASGVKEVRFWSSKFIVGNRSNGYSKSFCENIQRLKTG